MPQARSSEYLSPQPYFGERDDIELYFPDGTWCNNDGKNEIQLECFIKKFKALKQLN